MALIYKQLFRQLVKDRIFLSLLFLLTMLTSLCFFFVMFSIDGNMTALNALNQLTENQQRYKNALNSNTSLSYIFFASLLGLSSLVFIMFFYRFFRAGKKQIGCIKALGFKDNSLRLCFVIFTAVLSFLGALTGLFAGYYLSDILINANHQTYLVTGLTKGIGRLSVVMGLAVSTAIFCIVAFLCYGFVKNKEAGSLLAGNDQKRNLSVSLKAADKLCHIAPVDKRLSLRIALRKPLAVVLLLIAVMSFSVCLFLGQSLNFSSAKVFDAQTTGHNYEYDVRYSQYQTTPLPNHSLAYLNSPATVSVGNHELERTIAGLYQTNALFQLENQNGELLSAPGINTVYVNPEFSEIYGVEIGDTLMVHIAGIPLTFTVKDIAANADSKSFYCNARQLSDILGLPAETYNGLLSPEKRLGDDIITKAQRIEELKRNAVSNKISGVINQSVGIFVGAILIFLALYINFQDNTHDILILSMMGHDIKDIRKMLVDVYLPVLWITFAVTVVPSILLAKSIQKSLSISTNDYMPFGINIFVIFAAFALINFIYWAVQLTFSCGVKRVISKNDIMEIIYAE